MMCFYIAEVIILSTWYILFASLGEFGELDPWLHEAKLLTLEGSCPTFLLAIKGYGLILSCP